MIRSGPTFASPTPTWPASRQANTSRKPPNVPPFEACRRPKVSTAHPGAPASLSVQCRAAGRVDVRTLAEYLGHSDPAFTLRVYCHMTPGSLDRVRQAIDRAFSEAPDHPEITQEGETSL